MRIVNAELLIPSAEEIKKIVKMAYETGRAKGREEAIHELRGFAASPGGGNPDAGGANREAGVEAIVHQILTAGEC
jgi:hypothetical protein